VSQSASKINCATDRSLPVFHSNSVRGASRIGRHQPRRLSGLYKVRVAKQTRPDVLAASRAKRRHFTRLRACDIPLDRSRSTAAWRVDGHTVYEAHGTLIPEYAGIGFGIWTMLPIRDGPSRSLDGQGMNARWRRFRVCGVDA
jgi:Family of unknown function (DUF6081)